MIATAEPKAGTSPARAPLVTSLPEWLASAGDLRGEIAGVQVFGGKLGHVVRRLEKDRVDYYFPRERVIRHGRGEYDRAFIPGCLFVARGDDDRGWDIAHRYAHYMGWRVKFLRTNCDAEQAQLRKEVTDLGSLLDHDPGLRCWQGLRGGDKCRVTQGPFMGFEGYIDREGPRHTFVLHTTIFERSTPLEVPVEYLERL
jgi:transcription antitermination factor NusG